MNFFKNKNKFITFSLGLIFSLTLILSGITLNISRPISYASSSITNVTADVLSNANFNSISNSSIKPNTPSSWTIDEEHISNKDNIIKGVVLLGEDDFANNKTDYSLSVNPGARDNSVNSPSKKVLMINAKGENAGFLGYKSNSISLKEKSYYKISVDALTQKIGEKESLGSIYLNGFPSNATVENKIESFSTTNTWIDYSFLIETKSSLSLTLTLMLGANGTPSNGAVFFNEVKIYKYTEDEFRKAVTTEENARQQINYETKTNLINLTNAQILNFVNNANFETALTDKDWKIINKDGINSNKQKLEIRNLSSNTGVTAPQNNNSPNNAFALYLENDIDLAQGVESNKIALNPHSYYRLSVFAWSNCNKGNGGTIKIVESDVLSGPKSAKLSTITNKGDDLTRNGWKEYSFYIYSAQDGIKNISVQLLLGTSDSLTSGSVYFDDVRLEKINFSEYSSATDTTNSTKLSFNDDNSSFMVGNPFFNITNNEEFDSTYPLVPASWKKNSDTKVSSFGGIINTNSFNNDLTNPSYATSSLSPYAVPKVYKDETFNNVLMIANSDTKNTTKFTTSSSISLSNEAYYEITYKVHTQYTLGNGAYVKVLNGDSPIYTAKNIVSDSKWTEYSIFVKANKFNSTTLNIELGLENSTGYVYFDEILATKITETKYLSATTSATESIVDLDNEGFENVIIGGSYEILNPVNFDFQDENKKDMLYNGVINTKSDKFSQIMGDEKVSAVNGDGVLLIKSLNGASCEYKSKIAYSLASGTYYRISVFIKTVDIMSHIDQNVLKPTPAGAVFKLTNIENGFTAIDTSKIIDKSKNGYYEYVFYVNPKESVTTNIVLGLGQSTGLTNGTVLFDNLTVKTITAEEFGALDTFDDKIIKAIYEAPKAEEPTKDEEKFKPNFDWYTLPSIITALAIIIAVLGFFIRKFVSKHGFAPKIKTNYDRRNTLQKDMDKREKIELRNKIITELNAELESIDIKIEKVKETNLIQMNELNTIIDDEVVPLKERIVVIDESKKSLEHEYNESKYKPETNSKTLANCIKKIQRLEKEEQKHKATIAFKEKQRTLQLQAQEEKLSKYFQKQDFIRTQIEIIEREIEEIAKEDEKIWEEYKQAKVIAKEKKLQYKAEVKEYNAKISKAKRLEKTNKDKSSDKAKTLKVQDKDDNLKVQDKDDNLKVQDKEDNITTKDNTNSKNVTTDDVITEDKEKPNNHDENK